MVVWSRDAVGVCLSTASIVEMATATKTVAKASATHQQSTAAPSGARGRVRAVLVPFADAAHATRSW